MKHLEHEDQTLLYYGELSREEERAARAHLEECVECRRERDDLLRLFALVDACPVPEPRPGYEAHVWRELQPVLGAGPAPPPLTLAARLAAWLLPSSHRWAFAGALALLVVVAFTAGRFWPADRQAVAPSDSLVAVRDADLRERILLSALGDHFDRTQIVLVELAGTEPAGETDISGEQRRAADLLAATRLYRRAALEAGDRNVAEVLDALERVLVEVTVSPSTVSAYELQSLQNRIEQQELLFKLRVASSSLRHREQAPRGPAAQGRAGA
jgi:hypothetical protein